EAATARKLAWIREAAGDRFNQIEINVMSHQVNVTDDRRAAARQLTGRYRLPEDDILSSPHCLIGTVAQICDDLRQHRARYGISYIVVPELFMEALSPVVAQLAGE